MAHCSFIFICLLSVSLQSSLTESQYFENPETAIIEAVPADNTVSSNEGGDQDLAEDSSETCSDIQSFVESSDSDNHRISPEFESLNQMNPPHPDPYLRATYHRGHYYPYSAYNSYNNIIYPAESLNDLGRGKGVNYNDVWYPYTNPNAYEPVNYNIPPVKSLPPVYARLYGNSLPVEQEWFPSQIRRQRRLHENDDLLKQLEYDSIMKNILPTMYIPLPRERSRVPYVYAVFPHGASDCALPILLGCTPKITYGNMDSQNSAAVPYAHAYDNLLKSNNVHDHVDISDEEKEKVVKSH